MFAVSQNLRIFAVKTIEMMTMKQFLLGLLLLPTMVMAQTMVQEVPFNLVHVNDAFWAPRIEVNRTVSIPSAFRECEKNGRFDNFALAATRLGHAHYDVKEHKGDFPFDDTDPYKIIEGASYALAVKYDPQLDHYLDSVINIIALAQEDDGYLTTCVTNRCERLEGWWGKQRWEKINSHELYNSGHLIESAVAHYRATGKRTLLDVAIKNADLVCRTFGPDEGQIHRPGGHPIIEMALCKLYRVTGDKRYLEGATYFVDETGRCTDGHEPSEYSQDHMPIRQQEEIVGHAVRAGYLYSGVADVAAFNDDSSLREALLRIWNNMASKKLYITGGIGSTSSWEGFGKAYELGNRHAYCETCAAISNVYWNYRMFLATGESKYIDVCERALYNNVLSGVSLSGDRFFYDNPLESGGEHQRRPWFGCACCPGNITRFVASVPGYAYAIKATSQRPQNPQSPQNPQRPQNPQNPQRPQRSQRSQSPQPAIFVNLFLTNSTTIDLGGKEVNLSQQTDYPWDGTVTIVIDKNRAGTFDLKLRIPGWAKNQPVPTDLYRYADSQQTPVSVSLCGNTVAATPDADGYITLTRKWKKGDVVQLRLPMNVRRVVAHENVEADRGRVALERGPVVYCLEAQDQQGRQVFDKSLADDAVLTTQLINDNDLGRIVTLHGQGLQTDSTGATSPALLRAIPYAVWNNRGPQQMEIWIPRTK